MHMTNVAYNPPYLMFAFKVRASQVENITSWCIPTLIYEALKYEVSRECRVVTIIVTVLSYYKYNSLCTYIRNGQMETCITDNIRCLISLKKIC